jgi:hypothetical protein
MMSIGFGRGSRFRGCSPAGSYVGRGRGGLPRCMAYNNQYFIDVTEQQFMHPKYEISFLRNQAQALKQQLEVIESRIRDLEKVKEGREQ